MYTNKIIHIAIFAILQATKVKMDDYFHVWCGFLDWQLARNRLEHRLQH